MTADIRSELVCGFAAGVGLLIALGSKEDANSTVQRESAALYSGARTPEAVWQVWRPPYQSKIWYGDAIPIKSKAANLFIICNKSRIKTYVFYPSMLYSNGAVMPSCDVRLSVCLSVRL